MAFSRARARRAARPGRGRARRDLRPAGRDVARRAASPRPAPMTGSRPGEPLWGGCSSSAPRPTRTRWPRSRPSSATPSSCCPRPPHVPDVVEDADTLEGNARLKAVALVEATGHAGGRRRHRPRGRRARRRARACGRPASPARTPPTPTTRRSCSSSSTACRPTTRTARFRTVALVAWPDGREARGRGRAATGDHRRGGAGRAGLRLRPGVRARRRRRPHVRRDDRRPRSTICPTVAGLPRSSSPSSTARGELATRRDHDGRHAADIDRPRRSPRASTRDAGAPRWACELGPASRVRGGLGLGSAPVPSHTSLPPTSSPPSPTRSSRCPLPDPCSSTSARTLPAARSCST